MEEPKNKIARWAYWKTKANEYESLYQNEVQKNAPMKDELIETMRKLIIMQDRRKEQDESIKDLKQRISELEEIVKNKKKVK